MRILVLANSDIGLFKFRKELLEELILQGNHIYISLPNGEYIQSLVEMGCIFINTEVDRRGLNPVIDGKLIVKYHKIIKKINPDLVITYTVKPNVYGGFICRFTKIRHAANITGLGTAFQREGLLKNFIIRLYKISFKKARVVFFENDNDKRIFIDNGIVKSEKTYKLNGAGVNLEEYQFCSYPQIDSEIHFLFIGRVMKEKGIDELLAAAVKIKKKYIGAVFDIVGPFEDNYEQITENHQKNGYINYYGYQKDVRSYIEKSHCFVLPSYHEGMANTLLECGAMGRPLITSDIHGCKEAVLHEVNGYLVKVSDIDDLCAKIEKFINIPYSEKVKMGMASRDLIVNNFDKRDIVNRTIEQLLK